MDFVAEQMARKIAVDELRVAGRHVSKAITKLYDNSPSYAGEAESVKEAIDQAIRVLNGEPVD